MQDTSRPAQVTIEQWGQQENAAVINQVIYN